MRWIKSKNTAGIHKDGGVRVFLVMVDDGDGCS
jgi:hypothetical protein